MTRRLTALLCLLAFAPALLDAQSSDAATERARLANERIRVEAERRAREELERQQQEPAAAEREPGVTGTGPTEPPSADVAAQPARAVAPAGREPVPASPVPRHRTAEESARISRALEQLRDLGELKDAGYVTEEEFQRIKDRILEDQF